MLKSIKIALLAVGMLAVPATLRSGEPTFNDAKCAESGLCAKEITSNCLIAYEVHPDSTATVYFLVGWKNTSN